MPRPSFTSTPTQEPVAETTPILVDPEVSRTKLSRELDQWISQADSYRERGYFITNRRDLSVEVAFAAAITTTLGSPAVPVVTACVALDFSNYDLWPPSLTFLNFFNRQPARPVVGAVSNEDGQLRNLIPLGNHPVTDLPFLCLPGIREYHLHPQHSGDDWLLHRGQGAGTLASICDAIWRTMARSVVGMNFQMSSLPQLGGMLNAAIGFVQTDPDQLLGAVRLRP
jgi:putative metal binding uncharacterized protein